MSTIDRKVIRELQEFSRELKFSSTSLELGPLMFAIIESLPIKLLVVVIDIEGKILFANQTWRNTFGFSETELIGAQLFDFCHEEDRERTLAAYQAFNVRRTEEMNKMFINRYRCRDGNYKWIKWHYNNATLGGYVGSCAELIANDTVL